MNKVLVIANVFLGLLAFSLQVSALAMYASDPDLPSVGIWGGLYLVVFAVLLYMHKLKSRNVVVAMAVLAVLIGATLIGLYSWSINTYQPAIANCKAFEDAEPGLKICDRVAIDSLMIIDGILTVIVNGLVAAKASSFV